MTHRLPPTLAPFALLALLAACAAGPATDRPLVRDFGWLTGEWRGTSTGVEPPLEIVQQWSAPQDGQMRGQHRGYRDGEVVLLAPMRIVGYSDRVVLIGGTDGEPSRIYRLVDHGNQRLRFVSERRDFPSEGEFVRSRDRLTVTFRGDDGTGGIREVVYALRAAP